MIALKKISVLVLVFLGGVVSTLIVCGVAGYFAVFFFIDGYNLGKAVEAQQKVYVLKNIKEGNLPKAVELLEVGLDGGLIGLEKKNPTKRTDEAVQKAILLAKEYRAKYPWQSSSPDLDKMVNEVLFGDGNAKK